MPEPCIADKEALCPYCGAANDTKDIEFKENEQVGIQCSDCDMHFFVEEIIEKVKYTYPDCELNNLKHNFHTFQGDDHKTCTECYKIEDIQETI